MSDTYITNQPPNQNDAAAWKQAYIDLYALSREATDDYLQALARIAELEAQLAQTWQPLPDGEVSSFMYIDNGGKLLGVYAGDDYSDWYATEDLPDNIRLCRLVERAESQPTYSHRNGETEPPTVDGWYWWSGTVIGAYAEKGLVNITVPRNDANIQIWPSWCDGWLGAKDMQGQWYGPIVPPWEVDK